MSDKTTVAGEVDSYCTKCKLDLSHRIIAMVGDTIKKVECLTCGGHHMYRAPRSSPAKGKKAAPAKKRLTGKAAAEAAARTAAAEQRARWEQAIMGRTADDFTAYRMSEQLADGQLVRHSKFGDGVVIEVNPDQKVRILFEAGERVLVHAR